MLAVVGICLIFGSDALALTIPGMGTGESAGPHWDGAWDRFIAAWSGFLSWHVPVAIGFELLLATGLATIIATHPTNARSGWITEVDVAEQPKTLPLYAMVSVMVAEIVQIYPAMAFVVFGIGGLLRFRTDMGQPKLTGRALLATILGLAVGLQLFPLAIMGTAFGWVLIYVMERATIVKLIVGGFTTETLLEAADAWREALNDAGCEVHSSVARASKGDIVIVAGIPSKMTPVGLRELVRAELPEEYFGKPSIKAN